MTEKFDDEKFLKVLEKLYNRLFSLEQTKALPPRFSFALKDLLTHFDVPMYNHHLPAVE